MAKFIPPEAGDEYCGLILSILELAILEGILSRICGNPAGARGVSDGIHDAIVNEAGNATTFEFVQDLIDGSSSTYFKDRMSIEERETIIKKCRENFDIPF